MRESQMPQEPGVLGTRQKALAINLDPLWYGTFAEIGAGQEVARWFFRVGGAAGTIAKSVSAYDMAVSDSVYGKAQRYVHRSRLQAMLDHEQRATREVLDEARGAKTAFFTFADTVSAKNFKGTNEQHGWMGVKFQAHPRAAESQIIIHVRMLDSDNAGQSEALGIVGVNLLYGACFLHHEPEKLIDSLLDNLSTARIEIDMIDFSGAAFQGVDNRVASLKLVQLGLSGAAMFAPNGEVLQPSEVLYKRAVLVERGTFRPVTHTNMDMLRCSRELFVEDLGPDRDKLVELAEITMKQLLEGGALDYDDFLARADVLAAAGKTVLISDYFEYYRLVGYLQRYTQLPIGLTLGAGTLVDVLDEKVSDKLETTLAGGVLEALGRTFRHDTRMFVYPWLDRGTGTLLTAENVKLSDDYRTLYAFLIERGFVRPIKNYNPDYLRILPAEVARGIQSGDPSWEKDVPPEIATVIKTRALFGYKRPS